MDNPDVSPELLARLMANDAAAFNEVYHQFFDYLTYVAAKFLHNRQDQEEIAQDAFRNMWRSISNFRGECSFKTYLTTIVRRLAINKYHQLKRRKTDQHLSLEYPIAEDLQLEDVLASEADHIKDLELAEDERHLLRTLEALPDAQRQLIKLARDDVSYIEIGKRLGIPIGTVKSRLARARALLRQRLAEPAPPLPPEPEVEPPPATPVAQARVYRKTHPWKVAGRPHHSHLPNALKPEKRKELEELIRAGHTTREISRLGGAHRDTIIRLRAQMETVLCSCGKPATHRGWCAERYRKSPARQRFIQAWNSRRETVLLSA